jgi:subtilisin family serine protease
LKTTAIIAAAGNDSRRDLGNVQPVGTPANCPSILAVAAINPKLEVCFFSNAGSVDAGGGAIGIAGPGMDVYSSWPLPTKYKREAGTSMATPHVAGIAALIAQAKPNFTGADILNAMLKMAEEANLLPGLSDEDVGSGLVVSP